ncbi:unnamed protein product [Strongylus vulgaris]|uniref:Uncharacterized protein n=1 Tax=Strongylus vulgaris TaxID=40348 RepID=A0A3P7J7F0_STRVU|nr:unnamed protein product [Strongylus vulgaris]
MKAATAPGPGHVSVDFLQAGGYCLERILAEHLTYYLQKERISDQWNTTHLHMKEDREDLWTTVRYAY